MPGGWGKRHISPFFRPLLPTVPIAGCSPPSPHRQPPGGRGKLRTDSDWGWGGWGGGNRINRVGGGGRHRPRSYLQLRGPGGAPHTCARRQRGSARPGPAPLRTVRAAAAGGAGATGARGGAGLRANGGGGGSAAGAGSGPAPARRLRLQRGRSGSARRWRYSGAAAPAPRPPPPSSPCPRPRTPPARPLPASAPSRQNGIAPSPPCPGLGDAGPCPPLPQFPPASLHPHPPLLRKAQPRFVPVPPPQPPPPKPVSPSPRPYPQPPPQFPHAQSASPPSWRFGCIPRTGGSGPPYSPGELPAHNGVGDTTRVGPPKCAPEASGWGHGWRRGVRFHVFNDLTPGEHHIPLHHLLPAPVLAELTQKKKIKKSQQS